MVPGRDLLALLMGYLIGSLPFAQLISRWRVGQDIRIVGSGNAGARNVWHSVGPIWGAMVGALDVGKGLAAVLLARAVGASVAGALLSGPAAVLGHDFPLFNRFRGGKGLATTYGVLLAWVPYSTVVSMVLFALAQLLLRNMDRSIFVGASTAIFLPPAFGYNWAMVPYTLGLFLLLALRKMQDRSHESRVWAASGWQDVDVHQWYGRSSGRERSCDRSMDDEVGD